MCNLAGHLFLSNDDVKNVWSFTSTPSICLCGVVLRQWGNVTFTS
jgi:hypothetical protein